eukprot:TRINITY_DN32670_c0_g1_i1.p1 TRINITY_DN32670_c0_g1~~TRINITY_DN32670_c0_g1_i1.p1  ORF type:complete len:592 (+),score=52.03 TRINITY_DN32670_c0_g1_i1:123-1898(+)
MGASYGTSLCGHDSKAAQVQRSSEIRLNNSKRRFTNPVLRGSFPDPSILRVGEYFYMCNSSFQYYPGLPIHRSKDLVNWELVGHGVHREEQCQSRVNLTAVQSDGGIQAPSLRRSGGKFHIVATTIQCSKEGCQLISFVITAEHIEGPWSLPHVIEGAEGLDPDIFFDDDGKTWYMATHTPKNPQYDGQGEIWLQQLDTSKWRLIGQRYNLWRGTGGTFAEGPHVYKREGVYYLMVAEGGTSLNHAVTVAASSSIIGPYVANERNPILTSRHLSYDNWVHSTGHGDIVELPDGRNYMVCLGVRGDVCFPNGLHRGSNMGRETHLVPVTWERVPFPWEKPILWPVVAPGAGCVERVNPLPFASSHTADETLFRDDFDSTTLHLEWNFRRVPPANTYSLTARKGHLRLFARPEVISERVSASWLGVRQRETDFVFEAHMEFHAEEKGVEAGICFLQADNSYIKFTLLHEDGWHLRLILASPPKPGDHAAPAKFTTLKAQTLSGFKGGKIRFQVHSAKGKYRFSYGINSDARSLRSTFGEADGQCILSMGGFQGGYTGAYLGLYCTSNGQTTKGYADFDWVSHKPLPRSAKSDS